MGVSGTRHSVVEFPAGRRRKSRTRYADSGTDAFDPGGYEPDDGDAPLDDTQSLVYAEPEDSGIAILGGMATTEVPGDVPTAPQPVLNEQIAEPPRPVGDMPDRPGPQAPSGPPGRPGRPGSPRAGFGTGYGGNKTVVASGANPRSVSELALDQRLRIWRWRLLIMAGVGVASGVPTNWYIGLTFAILAGIIDTIYRARTVSSIPTGGSPDRAQRRTQRQLAAMRRRGYHTLHARPIPDSREVIDHLVVGPTGVYAIDSEKWRKEMPIRTRNGKQLWHGPDSKKQRLEHARWEAGQASARLSAALGTEIPVRPAMAVYGPPVPWTIATIRDVDVFSGPQLRKYMKRRERMKDLPRLTPDRVREIYNAAGTVLPDVAPTRSGVAPTRTTTPVG